MNLLDNFVCPDCHQKASIMRMTKPATTATIVKLEGNRQVAQTVP